jgi:DNA-3-methyladenine glycosylase II
VPGTRPVTLTRKTLLQAVHELAARDARLARIVAEHGPPPLWDREPGFPTLVRIILEQQVSLASAAALFAKFERHCAGPVQAERVVAIGEPGLLSIGFTRQKAGYVVGLAQQLRSGAVSLERIARLPDDDARDALIGIPGVGPWTAGVYLLMALRRPDVWPPGDLGLHKSMAEVRGLEIVPNSDQAAAYAKRWRPWRAVAARLLWHAYLARRAKSWNDRPTPEPVQSSRSPRLRR